MFYDIGKTCPFLPNGTNYNEAWNGSLSVDYKDDVFTYSSSNVRGGAGTASVTNGSAVFTVSRFTLATDGSLVDAVIKLGGVPYTIAGVTSGSSGTLTTSYAGTTNSMVAAQVPSGQGTGIYVIALKHSDQSCAVYNTYTGAVQANGSFSGGAIDSGCHGMYVHDTRMYRDGQYTEVAGASTGMSCGNTSNFWETGTTHAVSCTAETTQNVPLCGGHEAHGWHYGVAINNPWFTRFDPATANTQSMLPSFGEIEGNCEDHFSWNNAGYASFPIDTQIIVGSSANNNYSSSPTGSSWSVPGQNEVYGLAQNGTLIRFGHNFILGPGNNVGCGTNNVGPFDYYFTAQYAIGAVSQDGRMFSVSSSMLGQLGDGVCQSQHNCRDVDGHTRADVFVYYLGIP